MNKTITINKNHPLVCHVMKDQFDVYCGRWMSQVSYLGKSIWHNPFKEGTREENIQKFIDYLSGNDYLLIRIHELTGKRLACWCAPKFCHCTILAQLANEGKLSL